MIKTLTNAIFHRSPAHITQIGTDANVRGRVRRGGRGADRNVRASPHELRLIAFRESTIIHARPTNAYFFQPVSFFGPINVSTLHDLCFLHFIVTFRNLSPPKKLFAQTLFLLLQLSSHPNTLEKITLECHCITKNRTSDKSLAKLRRPLSVIQSTRMTVQDSLCAPPS